jgi:hypothetical protein
MNEPRDVEDGDSPRVGADRHRSSGADRGSGPRRAGTGGRHAPQRECAADDPGEPVVPGEILYAAEPVVINAGKDVVTLTVNNTGDRPVQVGRTTTSPR